MAIEEEASLNFTTSKNKTTMRIDVLRYRFNDLKTRSVYVYRSFSDTAQLIQKYNFEDTTVRKVGGWGFHHKRVHDYIREPQKLPDTTLNGITYQRLNLDRIIEGEKTNSLFYFQCNAPTRIFTFDSRLADKVGCPAVKFYATHPKKAAILLEVNFVRNTLNEHELKVFEVWKRFAKENPVLP